jgi:hypothetical protein
MRSFAFLLALALPLAAFAAPANLSGPYYLAAAADEYALYLHADGSYDRRQIVAMPDGDPAVYADRGSYTADGDTDGTLSLVNAWDGTTEVFQYTFDGSMLHLGGEADLDLLKWSPSNPMHFRFRPISDDVTERRMMLDLRREGFYDAITYSPCALAPDGSGGGGGGGSGCEATVEGGVLTIENDTMTLTPETGGSPRSYTFTRDGERLTLWNDGEYFELIETI